MLSFSEELAESLKHLLLILIREKGEGKKFSENM